MDKKKLAITALKITTSILMFTVFLALEIVLLSLLIPTLFIGAIGVFGIVGTIFMILTPFGEVCRYMFYGCMMLGSWKMYQLIMKGVKELGARFKKYHKKLYELIEKI